MKRRSRIVMTAVALCALGGVFYLYTQPNFIVQLANQVWACF